jgi:hypothetical protein
MRIGSTPSEPSPSSTQTTEQISGSRRLFAKQSGLGRTVLGGWTLQSIVNARSGYPLNVTIGRDVIGNCRAAGQRPDAVAGVDSAGERTGSTVWFTRTAFEVTGPTTQKRFGNLGYNTLRGPAAFWSDLALHKTFSVSERHRLQFRCEISTGRTTCRTTWCWASRARIWQT